MSSNSYCKHLVEAAVANQQLLDADALQVEEESSENISSRKQRSMSSKQPD